MMKKKLCLAVLFFKENMELLIYMLEFQPLLEKKV